MMEAIKNMIRTAINKGIDDTANFRRGVYTWLGREQQRAVSIVPFGTFGCPQEGTFGVAVSMRGQESNVWVLDEDSANRIKKECKPGEYGIGNPLTKANIYFKESGDVTIEVPEGKFTVTQKGDYLLDIDGNITINATGNVTINSDGNTEVNATGDAFINGAKVGANTDGLNPLQGVVTGECLDPVTGVPFPDKSAFVFAQKV